MNIFMSKIFMNDQVNSVCKFICVIWQMSLCFFWMIYSYIDMGFSEKVILLMISAVSGVFIPKTVGFMISLKLSLCKKILLVLAVVYLTFATVGQRGIIYPIDSTISIGRFIELLVTAIWYIPVITLFIYGAKRIFSNTSYNIDSAGKKTKRLSVSNIVILVLILVIPMVIMLITFNPGIASYDTNLCLSIYAHDLKSMIDNQPFFYVLCLKILISICDSTYFIVMVQIACWAILWIHIFILLNNVEGGENMDYLCLGDSAGDK